jgi:hypothetical protein
MSLIELLNRNGVKNNQSGGYTPKVSLKQVKIASNVSMEAISVIDAYVGEKLDRKNLVYRGDTGAAGHLEDDEVKFIIICLAVKIDEETIFNTIKEERERNGKQVPLIRTLAYYRKKYADLIDEVWVTVATRIGEVYSFTDKVYRLSRYNELATALEQYVVPNIKNGDVDKTLLQATNIYMNALRNINAEMGGVTLEKASSTKKLPEHEIPTVEGEVDVQKVLEDLVKKRFENQLPEKRKIEDGVGTSTTTTS